jgi:retron-type reverse transcriptase
MIPFRFDNDCRKILNNLNSAQCLNDAFSRILDKLAMGPLAQYLSAKEVKEQSKEKDKSMRERERKAQSQKTVSHTSLSVNSV